MTTDSRKRFDRRLVRIRRAASIELSRILGYRGYPDVDATYPLLVSREPTPDQGCAK
jgi:hypothetical protein